MTGKMSCPDCDWESEEDHMMYCPECGSRTEPVVESEIDLSEAETKTDKI